MRFIARASESSGPQGYQLNFFFFTQGLQKILTNSPHLLCIRNSHFEWGFFKSLGKNFKKWAHNTEVVRILNRLQKKAWYSVQNSALRWFLTTKKYTCVPATNTGLYFLWLRTNTGQSLEPIFIWFVARASES